MIAQIEGGDEVTLTNHGRPIARIVPLRAETAAERLLDGLDRIGVHDTGLGDEIAARRAADARVDVERW